MHGVHEVVGSSPASPTNIIYTMYSVLLYYKIIKIQHPESEVERHREICQALQLKGRILIGEDGINGTVGGSAESIRLYREYMNQHRMFKGIDFKESKSDIEPFPKLQVRARNEIITTEIKDDIDWSLRGKYVDRDTFHAWLEQGEDMVILDMRNDYEWEIGRFVGSVKPPMKYFRDLKSCMNFYDQFKGKKIVMFCTGGVRCEPASALFVKYGFDRDQVYHLLGGIVKYAEKYGNDGFYEGKCFVFDSRVSVPVNTTESAKIIGNCLHCNSNIDTYRNCDNKYCNKLFIACDECTIKMQNTCSPECTALIADPNNVRPPRANDIRTLHRNK